MEGRAGAWIGAAACGVVLAACGVVLSACGNAHPNARSQLIAVSSGSPPAAAPSASVAAPACVPLDTELPEMVSVAELDLPVPEVLEPGGPVMAPFYEKLAKLLRGTATDHVRIGVLGDSNMTMDFITGEMRRKLQTRYGDAGHGFIALAKPWSHYWHRDVYQHESYGYQAYAVSTKPTNDGYYGFSGIVAESMQQGALTSVGTADPPSKVGLNVGRFDVFYLKRPKAGAFKMKVDGKEVATIDASASEVGLGHYRQEVDDGPHRADFVATNPYPIRFLGVTLEREKPGIIVDSLGVGAMNTRCMTTENADINQEMLRIRPYDLVVFMTGANDIYQANDVPTWLKQVIDVYRGALPDVPIILATPPDRGEYSSFAPTLEIIKQRRELAEQFKTGFWSTFEAMGGDASMSRFTRLRLAYADAVHFTEAGGAWIADRFTYAIWRGFKAYLAEHPCAGQ
ncbi:MAG: GDSL-type esterase/lipase family protein [Polyangiaceae bacterium]